jgi:hypothetical protein
MKSMKESGRSFGHKPRKYKRLETRDGADPFSAGRSHPMDNTAGTVSLRWRIIQAYTRRALSKIVGETSESTLL